MATWLISDQAVPKTDGLKPIMLEPKAKLVHDAALQVIKDTGVASVLDEKEEDRKKKHASAGNDILVIDLFLTFQDPEFQHQQDMGGIALLKFLRIKGVKNHIVLMSPWSLAELLRMDPGYHVLASGGITIAHYTYWPDELKDNAGMPLKDLKPVPEDYDLRPWFKAGISLPKDERHNWAQWWGAECMRLMHNKVCEKVPEKMKAKRGQEIPQPSSISSKLKELKCAELMFVYSSWPEVSDAPDLTYKYMAESQRVLYVDDNCDMGWKEVLASFVYGNANETKKPGLGEFNNRGLVSMKPVGTEDRKAFYERVLSKLGQLPYAYVLLDVRLFAEPRSTPDNELSGTELLRRIRANHPTLPVILLTATARAEFFKAFEKIGLVEHWTKPSPEDSGKEDHLERSYKRLRRLLMDVAGQVQDLMGVKFAATRNAIDQIDSRIFGQYHFPEYNKLLGQCPSAWLDSNRVVVDTNFFLADDIHEVLPVLYFVSLARMKAGKSPISVINHMYDELSLNQERAAKGWSSTTRTKVEQQALGHKASFVLPFITNWMAVGRMLHYAYAYEAFHAAAKTKTNNRAARDVCNTHRKYFRGQGIVADDIIVCEFVQELKQKPACKVVLFSNESDTDSEKLPARMTVGLTDVEKQRFSYVRIDALRPVAKAIEGQLSQLAY